jgi:protein involved in polysaccharide export with SLBB domain
LSALNDAQRFMARQYCETGRKPEELPANFSALEQDYCRRASELVLQYGYETFDAVRAPDVLVNGAIPDTYYLGIGDELVVTLRGQVSTTARAVVDREGRIVMDNLSPVPAAGRTFGDFRRELQARIQAAFIGTDVFVSLGAVRLIAVSVVGEVAIPGMHQLTGLSTVLDAIALAGGVKKTGSLRRILIERRSGVVQLDLYDLLMTAGRGVDLGLSEGDRIVVPTVGATVAVAGKVKRPAIYELPPGAAGLSVRDAIELGGGSLRPIGNRIIVRAFDTSGREVVRQVANASEQIGEGSVVLVEYADDIEVGTVRIDGAVRVAGTRVRASAPSVRTLIGGAEALAPGAYLPFAVLETVEPATLARRYFPINLQRVLAGQEDFTLRDRDRLLVLSEQDVRFLSTERVQGVIRPIAVELGLQVGLAAEQPAAVRAQNQAGGPGVVAAPAAQRVQAATTQAVQRQVATQAAVGDGILGAGAATVAAQRAAETPRVLVDECRGVEVLQGIVDRTRSARFAGAVQPVVTTAAAQGDARPIECPRLYNENPDLLAFVLEHVVAVVGEVRLPGVYPVTQQTAVGVVVAVAGGVTLDADLGRVEFTRTDIASRTGTSNTSRALADLSVAQGAVVPVNPGDIVRFNAIRSDRDTGPILLAGEFVRPGYYDIRRGERLSEVMARAGGVTAQAYPYGAVFTRERVKRAEQEGLDRALRDLNAALVSASTRGELPQSGLVELQLLVRQAAATETIGRVVIEADPIVLQVRPELDVVLEPGDVLYMPKRPSTVLVTGDVLNPSALQFIPGMSVESYIRQAGGLQRSADRDRIFVLYPNGVAQPVAIGSAWTFAPSVQIPPGSAIVAPKDAAPFGLRSIRDITTLIGQIALTAASIAVIGR